MGIFSELRNDETFEIEFLEAEMPGIVDKLVCMDADYFLATPKSAKYIYDDDHGRKKGIHATWRFDIKIMTLRLSMVPSQITIEYLVNGNARVDEECLCSDKHQLNLLNLHNY